MVKKDKLCTTARRRMRAATVRDGVPFGVPSPCCPEQQQQQFSIRKGFRLAKRGKWGRLLHCEGQQAMVANSPHFHLIAHIDRSGRSGQWQFALRSQDGTQRFEAHDAEADLSVERLDLLTVVRALESLDQPSRVTLVECSDYVWTGVRYGLLEWRGSDWRWELFGQMVPVKNADLWQRLDRALQFHDVECRRRRFDTPHGQRNNAVNVPHFALPEEGVRGKLSDWVKYAAWIVPLRVGRRFRAASQSLWRWTGDRALVRSPRFVQREAATVAGMNING
jgi:ribonuclease HI